MPAHHSIIYLYISHKWCLCFQSQNQACEHRMRHVSASFGLFHSQAVMLMAWRTIHWSCLCYRAKDNQDSSLYSIWWCMSLGDVCRLDAINSGALLPFYYCNSMTNLNKSLEPEQMPFWKVLYSSNYTFFNPCTHKHWWHFSSSMVLVPNVWTAQCFSDTEPQILNQQDRSCSGPIILFFWN